MSSENIDKIVNYYNGPSKIKRNFVVLITDVIDAAPDCAGVVCQNGVCQQTLVGPMSQCDSGYDFSTGDNMTCTGKKCYNKKKKLACTAGGQVSFK